MRALAINDISCVGKCSLTVTLPIISACGLECSVLPTTILSTHTGGFTGYTFHDLTDEIPAILNHWESLGLKFDYICSGYLGSISQIELVSEIKNRFLADYRNYYMDNSNCEACTSPEMQVMRGRVLTVSYACPRYYRMKETGTLCWTDGMLGLNPIKFEVGNRVRYIGDMYLALNGMLGSVIGYLWDATPLVEFDELIPDGHDGIGTATSNGREGHCWYCASHELELAVDGQAEPEFNQRIVIVSDGKESTATLYDSNKKIRSATAAMPDGVDFDFMGCAKRALKQLDKGLKVAPEKEEPGFTGKVVCFETNAFVFSPGKMYDVIAGAIVNDVGNKWTGLHRSSGDTSSAIYQFSFDGEPYVKFIAITN